MQTRFLRQRQRSFREARFTPLFMDHSLLTPAPVPRTKKKRNQVSAYGRSLEKVRCATADVFARKLSEALMERAVYALIIERQQFRDDLGNPVVVFLSAVFKIQDLVAFFFRICFRIFLSAAGYSMTVARLRFPPSSFLCIVLGCCVICIPSLTYFYLHDN